jgi:hypothetical protein
VCNLAHRRHCEAARQESAPDDLVMFPTRVGGGV